MGQDPQTYLGQVFESKMNYVPFVLGLLFIIFGLLARYYSPQYDFGGWLGLGDGVLLLLCGLLIQLLLFGIPYFDSNKRRARGL